MNRADDALLRRVASLSPERRAMLAALLDGPAEQPEASGEATAAEASLRAIWEQVLGVGGIGLHDDFFAAGGDSIAAMRVAAKAQKIGLPITVRDLVTTPTIAALASSALRQRRGSSGSRRAIPLTPAQWREAGSGLLDHESTIDGFALHVPGAGVLGVADAGAGALARHDALGLWLRQSPAGWELVENGPAAAPLVDLTALPEHEACRTVDELERRPGAAGRDAERPLCRLICWRARDGAGLLVACHRWCADGESIEILRRELALAVAARLEGRPVDLPPAPRFGPWAVEHARDRRAESDHRTTGGRWRRLRGEIRGEVSLPPSWSPGEADGTPSPLERLALAALAAACGPHEREAPVTLDGNARTDPALAWAVGHYVRPMELLLGADPGSIRVAAPASPAGNAGPRLTCSFRQPPPSGEGAARARCTTRRRAEAPAWSRHPLEIRDEVEPGRWRTVWRYDESMCAAPQVRARCDRYLAEIARMAAARAADAAAMPAAFPEADLSADELKGLLSG